MKTRTAAIALAALFVTAAALACTSQGTIEAGTAPRTAEGQRLVLHLEDVRVPAGEAAVFRVFVNEHFIEELYLVPARSQASASAPEGHNFTFPVPSGAVKEGAAVTVKLVPDEGAEKLNVTVKRAYLRAE